VRHFKIDCETPLRKCTCHNNRVKRIDSEKYGSEFLYWSGGEDGVVLQHDSREPHQCWNHNQSGDQVGDGPFEQNVLIDLRKEYGPKAEVKCLAVNPLNFNYIVVGANDPLVRLYDRRMMHRNHTPIKYYVPGKENLIFNYKITLLLYNN